jgi:hypothetical protein
MVINQMQLNIEVKKELREKHLSAVSDSILSKWHESAVKEKN